MFRNVLSGATFTVSSRRSARMARLLGAAAAVCLFGAAPIAAGNFAPAHAQVRATQVSVEFRNALQPYGRWERHSRWGEVWIPAHRDRGWRPYTVGHWVYTNDWGWYWAEDRDEAAWGWVAYHYGRWAFDDDLGWCWVPGNVWGPAFVEWRGGGDYVGWAPLPPDDIVVEYRDQPEFWVFVRARDFLAPRIGTVIIARQEYPAFMHETFVVNQTVVLRDRGHFAVNPGIPAGFIAAAIGRPLHTYNVHPHVLAGTGQVPGATVVGAQQLQAWRNGGGNRNFGPQASLRQTSQTIAPHAQQLRPLAAGEHGRLGDNPPRAAREQTQQPREPQQRQGQRQTSPSTQGAGSGGERANERNQQQGAREVAPGMRDRQSSQTQGRSSEQHLREQGSRAAGAPENRGSERSRNIERQRPAQEGRAGEERRQQQRAVEEGRQQRAVDERRQQRSAEEHRQQRAVEERRQQRDVERRATRAQQGVSTEGRRGMATERRQPQAERSRGEGGRASVRSEPRVEQHRAPSTEGRGGGFGGSMGPRGGGAPHAAPMGGGLGGRGMGGGGMGGGGMGGGAAHAPMGGGGMGGGGGGHGR